MSGYIHDLHGTGLIVKLEDRCKVSRGPKNTSLSGSHWCMSLTTVPYACVSMYYGQNVPFLRTVECTESRARGGYYKVGGADFSSHMSAIKS